MKLTNRQLETLAFLAQVRGPVESGHDGSVLRALAGKGLVTKHFNTAPGYVYYTWTLTDAGKALAVTPAALAAFAGAPEVK